MSQDLIDLGASPFWIFAALAVFLLAPLAGHQNRSWIFAAINISFVTVLLGWRGGCIVAAGILFAWLLAIVLRRYASGSLWVVLSLIFATGLFLLHKLPGVTQLAGLPWVNPILSVIGYSYVCLRLIDLYRAMWEQRHTAPALVEMINYLLPFHMMAAGPIQSYDEFVQQPGEPRRWTEFTVLEGVQRIAFGAFKKFVVATAVQKMFLTDFTVSGWYWLLEVQMFFIWLYLDFSAYSDIAVGLGKLMGVQTPENFNRPYLARNITVFWERWHISLSLWIRRNIFYPTQMQLVRNCDGRYPMWCASIAFAASFLLCGLWHGIAWNFVVWGVMHASGLIAVNVYRKMLTKRLGAAGVKAYMANPMIKALAVAVTFEWVAISHLTFFYRF